MTQHDVTASMTQDQLLALVRQLQATNVALMAKVDTLITRKVTIKVNGLGERDKKGNPCKGNVSVYGIHSKYPVTLYANQWQRLLAVADLIRDTIEQRKADLSWKSDQED